MIGIPWHTFLEKVKEFTRVMLLVTFERVGGDKSIRKRKIH